MSGIEGLSHYIKNKKYKSINRPLYYVPNCLLEKKYKCQHCDINFVPNWIEKRPPITPVKLRKGDLWAFPTSASTPCPSCGATVAIEVPKGSFGEEFYFFADEAYRDFGSQYLVNYSLVGVRKKNYSEIIDMISSWKQSIYEINGTQVIDVVHLTDLWSQNARKKTLGAENLTKENVIAIYKDLAKKIENSTNIRIYSCSALLNKDKKQFRKQLQMFKEFVTCNLFNISIHESTSSGYIPQYFFEDDGKMGWIEDMFERMKLTLMFPFISNGKPVPKPKVIKKHKSQLYLSGIEAADLICFASARSAHNVYYNKDFDFDMSLLGNVSYIQFSNVGDVTLNRRIGYPGINA